MSEPTDNAAMTLPRSDLRSKIAELLAKATPGPWAWESIAEKSNEFAVGQAFDAQGTAIAGRIPEDEWIEDKVIERRGVVGLNESGHANFADAELICLLRNHADLFLSLLDKEAQR